MQTVRCGWESVLILVYLSGQVGNKRELSFRGANRLDSMLCLCRVFEGAKGVSVMNLVSARLRWSKPIDSREISHP